MTSSLRHEFTARLITWYVALFVAVLASVLVLTHGHFSFTLDDPYIHLALAKGIAHGHYGLNEAEATSPSSSLLWPLLLAPFAALPFMSWIPLGINFLLSLVECVLLGVFFARWYPGAGSTARGLVAWVLALLFVVSANLIGLTFNGMEHVLQIVLVTGCALGVLEAFDGRPVGLPYLLCAVLAPSVRYEDLAFTLALVLACCFQRAWGKAALTLGGALAPLVGFSLFLHAHGLAYLPNSVMVKGNLGEHRGSAMHRIVLMVAENLKLYLGHPGAWPILLFGVGIAAAAAHFRGVATRCRALLAALVAVGLMVAIGPYGWLHRYDVAVRLFGFLVVFAVLGRTRWFTPARAVMLACVASFLYGIGLVRTPLDAESIALEQGQMGRFAHDFYGKTFAVNDLGWVSFRKSDGVYVLDLWGLASSEAVIPVKAKNAAWLEAIAKEHGAGLVMIYPQWFQGIPATWTPVAELHTHVWHRLQMPGPVVFYATTPAEVPVLREEATRFAPTMGPGSWLVVKPEAGGTR